jgi:SAM-dependent methyltransferase
MPSLNENRSRWGDVNNWTEDGNDWSSSWGSVEMQWYATLYPRIHHFLPAKVIVEIAPGHGRWTPFLLDHCDRYIGIDLSESCVATCKRRFADVGKADFITNDGLSLPMVESGSADLIFSFDSLVHVEIDVMKAYLTDIADRLSSDGVAFLHHSNRAATDVGVGPVNKSMQWSMRQSPPISRVIGKLGLGQLRDWRAFSVSAQIIEKAARQVGLRVVGQEIINWGGPALIDCLSVIVRPNSKWDRANVVVRNPGFLAEADSAHASANVFGTLPQR